MKRNTFKVAFKKTILVGATTLLAVGLFTNALNARSIDSENSVVQKIKGVFSKEKNYNDENLLNILTNIENDINKEDIKSLRGRSKELSEYLENRNAKIHEKKHSEVESGYHGGRILEIDYGKRFNSRELTLALNVRSKPLGVDLGRNKSIISSLKDNELNKAKIKYVSFDSSHTEAEEGLLKLALDLSKEDSKSIGEDISDVYDDILIDQGKVVSLVSKTRDNLALARFLINEKQPKAAEETIQDTELLMLLLVEAKAEAPDEQQKIRKLRLELKNLSKAADARYLSEWEKIPAEIKDWWSKQ